MVVNLTVEVARFSILRTSIEQFTWWMYNYVLCSHDRGEKRKVLRQRSLNPGNSLPSLSTFPPDIFASLPYPLTPGTSRVSSFTSYTDEHISEISTLWTKNSTHFAENGSIFGIFERLYKAYRVDALFSDAVKFHHYRSFTRSTLIVVILLVKIVTDNTIFMS